jgi:hypothetical protein
LHAGKRKEVAYRSLEPVPDSSSAGRWEDFTIDFALKDTSIQIRELLLSTLGHVLP